MYVCMYVHMYVCMHVCTYVCMYVRMHTPFIQVNQKGVISFENFQIVGTPSTLHFSFLQMIAPFWADIDIRGTGNVFYRQTADPNLLARATNEIQSAFPTSSNKAIETLLIVTWDNVGYYFQHTDKVHTYSIRMHIHIPYSRNISRAEIFED